MKFITVNYHPQNEQPPRNAARTINKIKLTPGINRLTPEQVKTLKAFPELQAYLDKGAIAILESKVKQKPEPSKLTAAKPSTNHEQDSEPKETEQPNKLEAILNQKIADARTAIALVEDPETLTKLLEIEKAGANRKTIIEVINDLLTTDKK